MSSLATLILTAALAAAQAPAATPLHVRGSAHPKHTLIVYSEFQCSFCRKGAGVVDELLRRHPKDLRVVFKNFPLPMHAYSDVAARFFDAAALQSPEKAWQLHDSLFAAQERLAAVSPDAQKKVAMAFCLGAAKTLSLDAARLESDADSAAVRKGVEADAAEGRAVGITGAPGFDLDGLLIKGAYPVEKFEAAIAWLDAGRPAKAFDIARAPDAPTPAPSSGPAAAPWWQAPEKK